MQPAAGGKCACARQLVPAAVCGFTYSGGVLASRDAAEMSTYMISLSLNDAQAARVINARRGRAFTLGASYSTYVARACREQAPAIGQQSMASVRRHELADRVAAASGITCAVRGTLGKQCGDLRSHEGREHHRCRGMADISSVSSRTHLSAESTSVPSSPRLSMRTCVGTLRTAAPLSIRAP